MTRTATVSAPSPSKTIPTKGRVVLCFMAAGFLASTAGAYHPRDDYRPGIVANAWTNSAVCNVNVLLDGSNDQAQLDEFRKSPTGNTLASAVVYDPLTPEQRELVASKCAYWCEWMPFQAGQAQRAAESEGKLAKVVAELEGRLTKVAQALVSYASRHVASGGNADDLEAVVAVLDGREIPSQPPPDPDAPPPPEEKATKEERRAVTFRTLTSHDDKGAPFSSRVEVIGDGGKLLGTLVPAGAAPKTEDAPRS